MHGDIIFFGVLVVGFLALMAYLGLSDWRSRRHRTSIDHSQPPDEWTKEFAKWQVNDPHDWP